MARTRRSAPDRRAAADPSQTDDRCSGSRGRPRSSPTRWTPERAAKVAALFDALAAEWNERHAAISRYEALRDALDARGRRRRHCASRSAPAPAWPRRMLAPHFDVGRSASTSPLEMLRRARRATHPRRRVAGCRCATQSIDSAVLVNALLFPRELDRVLRAGWRAGVGQHTGRRDADPSAAGRRRRGHARRVDGRRSRSRRRPLGCARAGPNPRRLGDELAGAPSAARGRRARSRRRPRRRGRRGSRARRRRAASPR